MPMSAFCRPTEARPAWMRGFTLMEMIVVLALSALVIGLAAPRLQATLDAVTRSGEREQVIRQIERLPLRARAQGRSIVWDPAQPHGARLDAGVLPDLPDGWSVIALEPVRVEADGLCRESRVRVRGPDSQFDASVTSPFCDVRTEP